MTDWIQHELDAVAARGETRRLAAWPAPGPHLMDAGRRVLNLAGNDYLGLTAHPSVREAAARAAREIGPGSTASRLLAGTCAIHEELEAELAAWKGHPTALLFSSGYLAALGILPLLAGRDDLILADKLAHACLLDAARLSGAAFHRFRHNDIHDATRLLEKHRTAHRRTVLVTESIFSMDGDRAPLAELMELATRFDALFLVDEAHALGAAGPRGAGLTADQPESGGRLVTIGTLGKSLASAGGFVTGRADLRELMINRARSFIFDTAPPPPTAAAALAALREIAAHPEWTEQLAAKSARVRGRLAAAGLGTLNSESHIIPVMIGDNDRVLRIAAELKRRDILAAAIRPPTVPPGTARLRLSISLAHDEADLDRAIDILINIVNTCS